MDPKGGAAAPVPNIGAEGAGAAPGWGVCDPNAPVELLATLWSPKPPKVGAGAGTSLDPNADVVALLGGANGALDVTPLPKLKGIDARAVPDVLDVLPNPPPVGKGADESAVPAELDLLPNPTVEKGAAGGAASDELDAPNPPIEKEAGAGTVVAAPPNNVDVVFFEEASMSSEVEEVVAVPGVEPNENGAAPGVADDVPNIDGAGALLKASRVCDDCAAEPNAKEPPGVVPTPSSSLSWLRRFFGCDDDALKSSLRLCFSGAKETAVEDDSNNDFACEAALLSA